MRRTDAHNGARDKKRTLHNSGSGKSTRTHTYTPAAAVNGKNTKVPIVKAPMPEAVIKGSAASAAAIAHIMVL